MAQFTFTNNTYAGEADLFLCQLQ